MTRSGGLLAERSLQAAHDPEDRPELEDHLGQSHHGHVGGIGQEFDPRRLHPFSPHAVEGEVRIDLVHRPDEVPAVEIARGLSGHDHDPPRVHGCIRPFPVDPAEAWWRRGRATFPGSGRSLR